MKRILSLLILLGIVLPGSAHADLANMLVNDKLTDLSFKYLQDIFGVVDGILHGTGTQIMGQMFGAFNSAVLTLGFIIISYVFFVSTINTAHEGEIMGKKWSSIWIPLRVVASTALIVPKATGYCAIQIFVMGVVVSGVVAADKVMAAALVYIANGGVLIQSSPPPEEGSVKMAGNILKSLTCMNGVYNIVLNDSMTNKQPRPIKFVPTAAASGGDYTLYFPSADAKYDYKKINFQGFCGSVSWQPYKPDHNVPGTTLQDMREIAVQQIIFDLQPYSQALADTLVQVKNPDGTYPITPSVNDIVQANNISLVLAAADYKGIMGPYFAERKDLFAITNAKIIENTAKQGWIMLGSLYFNLAQLNHNANGKDPNQPSVIFTVDGTGNPSAYQFIAQTHKDEFNKIYCDNSASNCAVNVLTNSLAQDVSASSKNVIDENIYKSWNNNTDANGLYNDNTASTFSSAAAGGAGGQIIQAVVSHVVGPLYGLIYNMQALADAENQNTDPIIAVSGLGASLLGLVTLIWYGVGASLLSITLVVGIVPCINPGGFGVLSFLTWFVPLFAAVLVTLFVTGAVMAFYVPLIPFILFTFAALGWLAVVIEAMIAAPLVALGIAVPENHEIFGKAEPAILLLANVFLRPTLMVFGFFGGAILSHVGLWLLNKGYAVAWGWAAVSNAASLGPLGLLWALVAGLVIYMALVLAIINQTFGLIHQLPDELMRWLNSGLRALGGSPSDAISSVKGEFKEAAQAGGKSLQKAAQQKREEESKKSTDGSATFKDVS